MMRRYFRNLAHHPGVPVAAMLTVAGFIAGMAREGCDNLLLCGLFGAVVMGVFVWLPVLISSRRAP